MLDFSGQASGLRHLMALPPTRMIAVAALPQGAAPWRLLWLLMRQRSPGDVPVLVLDGLAAEHGDGLGAWLAHPGAAAAAPDGVLPAREGLLALCDTARREGSAAARRQLLQALPLGAIALLNAPPDVLAMLFMDSDVHPLVALDSGPRAVVEAYNAIKILCHAGGVHPVLVPLVTGVRTPELRRAETAVRQCCAQHLGEAVQSWPVAYHDAQTAGDAAAPESWWLRVLDSALAQEADHPAVAPRQGAGAGPAAGIRSS